MSEFSCNRLVIIGVGLIGGSIAAALRRAGKVRRIVGVGRGRANIERALELKVIDEASDDIPAAVRGADIVLLAVPVQQNERVLVALAGSIGAETLVTDAGSTKMDFVAAVRRILSLQLANVIPAHPIAGAELTGVDAASAGLFVDKNVVLTPLPENDARAVDRIESMWKVCGARVGRMSPEHHDRVFSAVSHLPHMLAYTLVHMIATRPDAGELFSFAAGGFRDVAPYLRRTAGNAGEIAEPARGETEQLAGIGPRGDHVHQGIGEHVRKMADSKIGRAHV